MARWCSEESIVTLLGFYDRWLYLGQVREYTCFLLGDDLRLLLQRHLDLLRHHLLALSLLLVFNLRQLKLCHQTFIYILLFLLLV